MKLSEIWTPLKACILVTRKCNYKCSYCGVIDHRVKRELSEEEFKKVFSATRALGVGINIIFGGEPSIKPGIKKMIEFLNKEGHPYAFITNSSLAFESYEKLDLKQLSCSVDLVERFDTEKYNELKSYRGLHLLLWMRGRRPDMDLLANVGLSRFNLQEVPKMVEFFSERNIWVIATPLHDDPLFESEWLYRKSGSHPGRILPKHEKGLLEFCEKMVRLKEQGYLVHQFASFFTHYLPRYGIGLDWHCSFPAHLTINPDGGLLCCIDRAGLRVRKYKVWDLLDPKKLIRFKADFALDVQGCPGCCWDHIIESEHMYKENPEQGKRNFQHVK